MTATPFSNTRTEDWQAVCISEGDNVAVALSDLKEEARVLTSGRVMVCRLRSAIPLGHKFALTDLSVGTKIRKYGEIIGILTDAVMKGEHVHTHNLASLRAGSQAANALLSAAKQPQI